MAQGSALVYGKTRSRGISMHRTSRGMFYKILVVATIIALLMSPVPRAQAEPMTITAMLLTTALAGAIWGAGTYLIGIYILGEPFDVVDMLGSMVFNACLFMAMLLIPIIPAPAIMTSLGVQVITNHGVAYALKGKVQDAFQWVADLFTTPDAYSEEAFRNGAADHEAEIESSIQGIVDSIAAETGEVPPAPQLSDVRLAVASPASNATVRHYDIVSATVASPADMEVCPDEVGRENLRLITLQHIAFEYSLNGGPWTPVPTPDSDDNRDWWGCNGYALRFDTRSLGLQAPTSAQIRARALDTVDRYSEWAYSGPILIDSRPAHDYAVTNLHGTPSAPDVGETVQVAATVTNVGATAESNVRINFYQDGQWRNSHFIASLAPGASAATSFSWIAEQGAHTLVLEAELTGDSDPGNDSDSGVIIVGTAPLLWVNGSGAPAALQISATTQGTTGTFHATVQNVGSESTTVTVSRGGPQASWITLGTTSFTLAPNTSRDYAFTATVPANQTSPPYAAELVFSWTGGASAVVLPIQFGVGTYSVGQVSHTFSPSSGTVDGSAQSVRTAGWYTYVTLDNYPGTTAPYYLEGSFDLSESEYHRIKAGSSGEWTVNVTEVRSESTSTALGFRRGTFYQTRRDSWSGGFDIYPYLVIGANTWRIAFDNVATTGSNTEWQVNETKITLGLTQSAWWASYNPGDSTVAEWEAGLDYARICATVNSVSQAGDVSLYNNGQFLRSVNIDSSDVGHEVCWSFYESGLHGSNTFALKAAMNGARVNLSNIHFEVHYYSGSPAIQAVRSLSTVKANVNQNVTANLSFANVGSNFAEDVAYGDMLPSGLQLVSGSLGGTINPIDPAATESRSYTLKGTVPSSYAIPGLLVTYEDPSGSHYITTLNVSVLEVWGGALQPHLGALAPGTAGTPVRLVGTVSSSLGEASVAGAKVIADITRPDLTTRQVALQWNPGTGQYEGEYIPTAGGEYGIALTASKLFYETGSSPSSAWQASLPNQAPAARAAYEPGDEAAPLVVTLDGGGSIDADGLIMSYDWDIGADGSVEASGRVVTYTFATTGTHTVTLTVTDNTGDSDSDTIQVEVGGPSQITVDMSVQVGWNLVSLPVELAASLTAQQLCDAVNNQGGHAVEIDRWNAGGWESHVCGLPFNDFDIQMGKGYFVKSATSASWSVSGQKAQGTSTLAFSPGWNLVSVPLGIAYTAEEFGDAINAQGGSCVEIDRWYAGGWDSHIINLPFNNFAIAPASGYFVRCTAASTMTITVP